MLQHFLWRITPNYNVIYVHQAHFAYQLTKHSLHYPLKAGRCVSKAECHPLKAVLTIWSYKHGYLCSLVGQADLPETALDIQRRIVLSTLKA